jgi:hypothetical protein
MQLNIITVDLMNSPLLANEEDRFKILFVSIDDFTLQWMRKLEVKWDGDKVWLNYHGPMCRRGAKPSIISSREISEREFHFRSVGIFARIAYYSSFPILNYQYICYDKCTSEITE